MIVTLTEAVGTPCITASCVTMASAAFLIFRLETSSKSPSSLAAPVRVSFMYRDTRDIPSLEFRVIARIALLFVVGAAQLLAALDRCIRFLGQHIIHNAPLTTTVAGLHL